MTLHLQNKKLNVFIYLFLLVLIVWKVVDIYQNNKPKTSADLSTELMLGKEESLVYNDDQQVLEDLKEHVAFFENGGPTRTYQYTVFEHGDEIMLLETTPGLVNNQLQIKRIKMMTKEAFFDLIE